jgi:glucokinase
MDVDEAGTGLIGAIDLGGTKILSLVVDMLGEVHGVDVRPTEAHRGPDAVLRRMVESLTAALVEAGRGMKLEAVGVAAPGPIDFEQGTVVEAPNLPGWANVPVVELIADMVGCPAILENDANAAAWGEFTLGAGRGSRHLVYLTVSTGIGGGLVLDGRLYRGANGAAGEIGHIPLVEDGPRCGCGARGCLEALASGTAIARRAREALATGAAPILARLAGDEPVTARTVYEAAVQGDAAAQAIMDEAGRHLGRGITAVVNVFNPDHIVLGGGVMKSGEMLLRPALAEVQARALRLARDHVQIALASLGDRSGALGAAMLARELVVRAVHVTEEET